MTKNISIKELTNEELGKRLTLIHEKLNDYEDKANAKKIVQLIEKASNKELNIAFCGHFSAGKSTMINKLFQEELLPSSPIPTSANVVKVKTGEPYARIFFNHSEPVEFSYPYDIKKVKNYCLDGEEVASVEISHPSNKFPNGVAILDTPGVDSTDDAHRIATEASLHLADVIFYVMDYNHVQAESNFQFTKMLQNYKKPLYLIINQVDKHNEDELSFESFKKSVMEGFSNWNVNPAGVFYTSLKDKDHPHNDFENVKSTLHKYINNKESLVTESVFDTTKFLIKEFTNNKKNFYQEELHELQSRIEGSSIQQLHSLEECYVTDIAKSQEAISIIENEVKELLGTILKDAILMPYQTRELAEHFLEAYQDNFKVGLIFSKKKTEEERQKRLIAFFDNVNEQIQTNLEWVVKEQLIAFTKEKKIYDESFKETVFNAKFLFSKEELITLVKKGATLNRQYILTYTNDVANEIKKQYRSYAIQLLQPFMEELSEANLLEQEKIVKKLTKTREKIQAFEKIAAIEKLIAEMTASLESSLKEEVPEDTVTLSVKHSFKKMSTSDIENGKRDKESKPRIDKKAAKENTLAATKINLQERARQLETIANSIKDIPGIKTVEKQARNRAKRLASNRFTIALFGAFSAGKSSFANALIGEKVLPVSPNPTTATINKILPVDQNHEHGTILVYMKSTAEILADIQYSLQIFNKNASTLEEAIRVINEVSLTDVASNAKPHYSFLKAFAKGFASVSSSLGEVVKVDRKTYEQFVAQEHKACFVNSIELYYDCELTKQGVILVDTPGADSINARHTDVAFDYIKNADAVLFVTYYNHAFNHADREFLIQLGRVKDAFELDKMFFIINAKDLAQDESELQIVAEHVEENLTECGIRHPRLYPVSSKEALTTKDGNESGMAAFKADFLPFISNELAYNVDQAAINQIRAIENVLADFISTAEGETEQRETEKDNLQKTIELVKSKVVNRSLQSSNKALEKEIEELLFYVKKRVLFRFNEGFKHAFNPSSLQEDGRNIKKALNNCLDELIDFLTHDLAQELRATTIRIENYINKQLQTLVSLDEKELKEASIAISLKEIEVNEISSPKIRDELQSINMAEVSKPLNLFKSGKQFFEQGGSKKMKESLEELLENPIADHLGVMLEQFSNHYIKQQEAQREDSVLAVEQLLNDYQEGKLAAYQSSFDVNAVKEILQFIHSQNA